VIEDVSEKDDGGHDPFEKHEVDEEAFLATLGDLIGTMDDAGVPYCFIGAIPLAVYGRPRSTLDIDLFLRGDDLDNALVALQGAGFVTKEPELSWLHKASKRDVPVDLVFRSQGDVYMDQEVIEHVRRGSYKGHDLPVISAEDLLVMKALSFDDETPEHWFDGAGLVVHQALDWPYVVRRARFGPRKVLAMLLWAQGEDAAVPEEVLRELFESVFGEGS
jgi:predicted nucleotidyltransferase